MHRRIENSFKHLRWVFLTKIVLTAEICNLFSKKSHYLMFNKVLDMDINFSENKKKYMSPFTF